MLFDKLTMMRINSFNDNSLLQNTTSVNVLPNIIFQLDSCEVQLYICFLYVKSTICYYKVLNYRPIITQYAHVVMLKCYLSNEHKFLLV